METDWIFGLVGGVLIGSAAAAFLLLNGRIMGASGLLGGLVDGTGRANWVERLALIAGLILVPLLVRTDQHTHLTQNLFLVGIAGLLVGVGTRLANGCTSGHGVCGISRFSLRGIVATLCYLLAGGVSLYVFRHLIGVV